MQQIENASTNTAEWQALPNDRIGAALQKYFPLADPQGGNSGYGNQWSRLIGIRYGTIAPGLFQAINNGNTINMMLATVDETIEGEVVKKFTILFNTGGVFYGPDSADPLQGWFYDTTPVSTSNDLVARYGISPNLVNHLSNNYLAFPFDLGSLFYSWANNRQNPNWGRSWVRATNYPISFTDDNYKSLQALLRNESIITIRLGLSPGSLTLNEEMFSLILEIDNSQVPTPDPDPLPRLATINYLDFVGASPPLSPGSTT